MMRISAKSNLGIIFKNISKNISIAAVLFFGLTQATKAEPNNNHQDLYISCNPAIAQGTKLNCSFNPQSTEINQGTETQIAQGTRGRKRKSKVDGYYGGFSVGLINPSGGIATTGDPNVEGLEDVADVDYGTGFAGSIFGGIKFSEIIGAELEFLLGLGKGDTDEFNSDLQDLINSTRELSEQTPGVNFTGDIEAKSDYSAFAIYASPRFDLPVSQKFSLFITPGIGLSQTNVNVKVESDLSISGENVTTEDEEALADAVREANQEIDQSTTGISFKLKAGAEYQLSDSIEIFGQATYVTLPVNDDPTADDLNSFLAQTGLTFNF
jgi:opacity protein-like surface antigen